MAMFACPGCGKQYGWKPELAGRKAKCQKCGQVLVVPASPEAAAAAGPAVPQAPAGAGAVPAGAAPAQAGCPSCKQPVAPGAVICVQCGYNFKTGQRLSTQVDRE